MSAPARILRSVFDAPHAFCVSCNAICPPDDNRCTQCWSTGLIPGDTHERTASVDPQWLAELEARSIHMFGIEPAPSALLEWAIPQILDAARNGLAELHAQQETTW